MNRLDAVNFRFEHPFGTLYGYFTTEGLAALRLPRDDVPAPDLPLLHSAANDMRAWQLNAALERYFAGQRQDFQGIPLDLRVGTPFQRSVWNAARAVPWGTLSSYGALAASLGKPGAARAVGGALGKNPVPILVPCHRFIRQGGGLGGFGAGVRWKTALIEVEGGTPAHPSTHAG
jgi:O-6-methylguanine DNA methyltransferase